VRKLQQLTLLTLVLVLPGLTGFAYVPRCSMSMSDSQALTPAGCCPSEVEQGAPCKQQGEPPLTGKCLTCLACPACQAPQTCDSIDLGAVLLAPTRSVPSAESSALPSSHPPSGLWRPPPPPL